MTAFSSSSHGPDLGRSPGRSHTPVTCGLPSFSGLVNSGFSPFPLLHPMGPGALSCQSGASQCPHWGLLRRPHPTLGSAKVPGLLVHTHYPAFSQLQSLWPLGLLATLSLPHIPLRTQKSLDNCPDGRLRVCPELPLPAHTVCHIYFGGALCEGERFLLRSFASPSSDKHRFSLIC